MWECAYFDRYFILVGYTFEAYTVQLHYMVREITLIDIIPFLPTFYVNTGSSLSKVHTSSCAQKLEVMRTGTQ